MKFVFTASFWWLVVRTGSKPGAIFSNSSHAIVYIIKQYSMSRKFLSHNPPNHHQYQSSVSLLTHLPVHQRRCLTLIPWAGALRKYPKKQQPQKTQVQERTKLLLLVKLELGSNFLYQSEDRGCSKNWIPATPPPQSDVVLLISKISSIQIIRVNPSSTATLLCSAPGDTRHSQRRPSASPLPHNATLLGQQKFLFSVRKRIVTELYQVLWCDTTQSLPVKRNLGSIWFHAPVFPKVVIWGMKPSHAMDQLFSHTSISINKWSWSALTSKKVTLIFDLYSISLPILIMTQPEKHINN